MARRTMITCDACGRDTTIDGSRLKAVSGPLHAAAVELDTCPSCWEAIRTLMAEIRVGSSRTDGAGR